jgi:thiamine kinase-like enzyme
MAALYHAVALVRAGMDGREVNARVTRYWEASRTLRPQDPLSPHDLQSILKSARKKRRYTHLRRETYLTALRATPAERSYLFSIIEAVTVRFRGTVPSTRVMADYLASIGIPAGSHVTVSRDYAALGYQTQAKPGRPPKLPL